MSKNERCSWGLIFIANYFGLCVAINGYLAYSVNYTRAFRVKNGIINILEQYEGHTEEAKDQIAEYVQDMNIMFLLL